MAAVKAVNLVKKVDNSVGYLDVTMAAVKVCYSVFWSADSMV